MLVGGEPAADGLAAILRVHWQYGPCRRGGSAWQRQLRRAAAGAPFGEGAGQDEAGAGDGGELGGDLVAAAACWAGVRHARSQGGIDPWSWSCPTVYLRVTAVPACAARSMATLTRWPRYIARWRPSSVSPQAAAFARDVITAGRAGGPGAGEEPAVGGGQARRLRASRSAWTPAPEVVLHPSVTERFTRCAPGLSGVARRTLRTNLRFIGRRVVPQLYPADMPLPRERAKAPYSPAEIAGYLALAGRAAHAVAADARERAGLPGRRRRADPRRPARRARHRRDLPVRRGDRGRPRRPAAGGAGAGPLPRPAAGRGARSPGPG